MSTPARVLSIAGSDPSGGAGIQADLKSIFAAGGYGMTAITALTAQNTQGVLGVHTPPAQFLTAQLDAIAADVEIDAVKIGMLGSAEVVAAVSRFLNGVTAPVVLDPVMVATSGDRLLDAEAEDAVRDLCTKATVITPNLKELAVLTGTPEATDLGEAIDVARAWAAKAGTAVVVKGGHLNSEIADNAWVDPDGTVIRVGCPRVNTSNTHGTGCSLSSALATRLGAGDPPQQALEWSTAFIREAIAAGSQLQVGKGNGPIDHSARLRRLAKAANTAPLARPKVACPEPTVKPAGPHTQKLWELSALEWRDIVELDFIKDLGSGQLDREAFLFYLDQDAKYLGQYSKALGRLAIMAPTAEEHLEWAQDAVACVEEEAAMHRSWLHDQPEQPASPVTAAYTDFLIAATHTDDYAVGVAAVLPCFWLYAEVATHLSQHNHAEHVYGEWLAMYSDPVFCASASRAVARMEKAMEAADSATRARATAAYLAASRHEVHFFDQAHRRQ
ncbi:4-amino-5-aminomethyl-2-methylpyrimidine hydrolase [Corynebacterium phocae]|uniref:Thiamine biosynthesis multifunctional protein ThiED n=2 Tax=Corynebacterium phocae TaxID=161895 RepID=A0A1L7D302_9CORY|nr:bifunctional hydroxymethylpyrimidine kinase/phosphomethylpyrimidine kinase [Corynebacterium phocae]APT92546.1 4-amino-5-aminomethyl-2-methylpyrimidine hydrolase [Corynebacterium phocae]KAA8725148.1 bifunctional hydroxymethylpyrimidine kinase/phosphomethylpyrimidine kinase [Corynebacterium phocae]